MKRLILIDSHAIIHRAYHALPPLTAPGGKPTNAVYGFTTILLRIIRELKPDYIAAAFDLPGPTFRHIAYERYKAQRPETPSDLSSQFGKVREILDAFGIACFEEKGYEADDIIGTIAGKLETKKDLEIVIVTGDLDALQLVGPRLKVYSMKKGISDTIIYDVNAVKDRYGLKPAELVDFKGLRGDPSDNIPGVKGIGEKGAAELIKTFGSIEGVYNALKKGNKKISAALAIKLKAGEEDAKFSKALATIQKNVPLKISLDKISWSGGDNEKIKSVFQKFGFWSLLKRLDAKEAPSVIKEKEQGTLMARDSGSAPKIGVIASIGDLKKLFKDNEKKDFALVLDGSTLFLIQEGLGKVFELFVPLFKEKELKSFLGSGEFFVHNGKAIVHFLQERGIVLGEIIFDTAIASYLTGSFIRDFSYLAIASRELGRMVSHDPKDELLHFFEIVESLDSKLNEGKLMKIFAEVELPLISILAQMEKRGIKINTAFLGRLAEKINGELSVLTKSIYKDAGDKFNISSPQQLSEVLFEKLQLGTHGLRKTEKGGRISTGAAELEKLKGSHPVVEKILEHRELMKLKTTYVDTLPKLADKKTGRIHTSFNQTGTATGRLSSSDPNIQNIPILSEYGREVRKAFIAEDGFSLASFDYSQIELRVAAHMAQDQKMIEAFRQGVDIHAMTAAEINNIPLDRVTPELRRAAKTLNFGILYGMGSQALAESAGMTKDEAKKFIDEYFRDFSGIRKYIDDTKRLAEEQGFVETLFGRRRYIPEIYSPNWQLKREAERMAVNMPIQGTATGDIIKMAMIKVDEWIRKEESEKDVRLLLQVHDELLFEIKEDEVSRVAPRIKKIMEQAVELSVPLVVDVKVGKNWGEA